MFKTLKTFCNSSNCVHKLHSSDFTFFLQYKCSCPRVRIILSISRPHFPSFEYLSHFLYVHVTKYTKCVRCLYIPDKIQLPWQTVFINSSSLKNLRWFMVIIIFMHPNLKSNYFLLHTHLLIFWWHINSPVLATAQCWPLLSAGTLHSSHTSLHSTVSSSTSVQSPLTVSCNKHFEGSCELLSLNLILMLTSC